MDWFAYEVSLIEEETISFINESFKKLSSAEAAFGLFKKFKHVRSRKCINAEMMRRFQDILAQFTREVETESSNQLSEYSCQSSILGITV